MMNMAIPAFRKENAEQDRIMSGRNAGSAQQTAQILDLGTQEVDSGDNDGNRAFIDAAVVIKRHADTNSAAHGHERTEQYHDASPGRPPPPDGHNRSEEFTLPESGVR